MYRGIVNKASSPDIRVGLIISAGAKIYLGRGAHDCLHRSQLKLGSASSYCLFSADTVAQSLYSMSSAADMAAYVNETLCEAKEMVSWEGTNAKNGATTVRWSKKRV